MLEKATYVHTHTHKNHLSSHKASCFCFCSKHCFSLIIISPLVSYLISATEYLLPFTTNSQSDSCLLSWNTVHLLIPISGRYTFHGRWQRSPDKMCKCSMNTGKMKEENAVPMSSVCCVSPIDVAHAVKSRHWYRLSLS